jgi:hypothetical protein
MGNQSAGGVILTTVCDQMRRAFDILVCNCKLPAFLMNVPSTWQNLESQKLYIQELMRLSRFLTGLGGKSPSNKALIKTMLEYDVARVFILAAREYLSARQFAEAIASFGQCGPDQKISRIKKAEIQTDGIPLAIVGGPLMKKDFDLFDMIEKSGGRVVLDATETGERGMCARFDRRRIYEDPLMELANAYFSGIQDVSRRPNSELYKWLRQKLASRNVKGIIYHRYLWCDLWHAELNRLKDWINLQVLEIDTAGDNETDEYRTVNRIHAFLEMLQ